jgi:hypothetical protein
MKIKTGEIRFINEGLQEILQKELPAKPSYWLGRFLNKLSPEMETFEKARVSLVTKHAKKDDEGKPMFKLNDKGEKTNEYDVADMEAFQKEFLVLAEQEFEIEFNPIKLADLGDIKLKPIVLARLSKIIEE